MLRDPKEVAVVWSGKTFYGSVDDTRNQMADLILADRRAVIEEAKKKLCQIAYSKTSGHGDSEMYVPLYHALRTLDSLFQEETQQQGSQHDTNASIQETRTPEGHSKVLE